jgi:hypothetical protein
MTYLGRKMMRQVAGAFMEYEKGRLVAKLRGARERKRKEITRRALARGGCRSASPSEGERQSRPAQLP